MTDGDDIFMDDIGFDAWDVGTVAGIAGVLLDGHARKITDGQQVTHDHHHHEEERAVTVNAAPHKGEDLTWDQFIGQESLKQQLRIHIQSAKHRGVALEHVLLASGRPGVGKTTMGKIISQEMGGEFFMMVPPFHRDALIDAALELGDGDILFIDEIHKLADHGPAQAENLLHLMEEKAVYTPSGRVQLADITIIGATTDADKLPETIIDRFPIKPHFEEYSYFELLLISNRFEQEHDIELPPDVKGAIAKASRNTPRVIRELVIAARDLIIDLNGGLPQTFDERTQSLYPTPRRLLNFKGLTPDGLTPTHRDYITGIYRAFGRTTNEGERIYVAGEMSLVTMMRMPKRGLARLERELIELGYIDRTPQGRQLTQKGVAAARKWTSGDSAPKDYLNDVRST